MIGDIPFIPALVILAALVAAVLRRWLVFGFIVGAIAVEVATYRVTSLIVHRAAAGRAASRPDHLPVNQSFPSGHVAASVVVYVGLALLISSRVRDRRVLMPVWTLAIALPLVVALVAHVPRHAPSDRRGHRRSHGPRRAVHRGLRLASGRRGGTLRSAATAAEERA